MSGGIDSTATCLMLREQGYEIVGLTMWVWGDEPVEARNLADSMGIEHHVADEREAFRQIIVQNFIDEYRRGRTPNPCVMCNPLFKFRILTEWADRLGCAFIATGHYTRLEERNGKVYIVAGDDDKKDQSYFLWRLGQEVLKRCIFPLGAFTKMQVREYLRDKGYTLKAEEGESMEVCFIKGDYRDFLREHSPEIDSEVGPGWFVNSEGVKLGEHKGFPYYTIGQRKGIGVPSNADGKRYVVVAKDFSANTLVVDFDSPDAPGLYLGRAALESVSWINKPLEEPRKIFARARYRDALVGAFFTPLGGGNAEVEFETPQRAIAPGQIMAIHDASDPSVILGGAIFSSPARPLS